MCWLSSKTHITSVIVYTLVELGLLDLRLQDGVPDEGAPHEDGRRPHPHQHRSGTISKIKGSGIHTVFRKVTGYNEY